MTDVIRKYGNPNFPDSIGHFNKQPKECLRRAKCEEVLNARFEDLEVDDQNDVNRFARGLNKLVKNVLSLNPQWSRSSRFPDKKMSTNSNPNSMDIKVKGEDGRQFHNKNKRKYTDNKKGSL